MFAQNQNYNIRSRVLTLEDSIPVSFATVRLMQTDSVMVGSTLTDLNGLFGFDTPLKEADVSFHILRRMQNHRCNPSV